VIEEGGSYWVCIVVYANPNESQERKCFEEIRELSENISVLWMVVEDFNEVLIAKEKTRGVAVDSRRCARFSKLIQQCDLMDLGSVSPRFT
jgi:hypothetical protein